MLMVNDLERCHETETTTMSYYNTTPGKFCKNHWSISCPKAFVWARSCYNSSLYTKHAAKKSLEYPDLIACMHACMHVLYMFRIINDFPGNISWCHHDESCPALPTNVHGATFTTIGHCPTLTPDPNPYPGQL